MSSHIPQAKAEREKSGSKQRTRVHSAPANEHSESIQISSHSPRPSHVSSQLERSAVLPSSPLQVAVSHFKTNVSLKNCWPMCMGFHSKRRYFLAACCVGAVQEVYCVSHRQ